MSSKLAMLTFSPGEFAKPNVALPATDSQIMKIRSSIQGAVPDRFLQVIACASWKLFDIGRGLFVRIGDDQGGQPIGTMIAG